MKISINKKKKKFFFKKGCKNTSDNIFAELKIFNPSFRGMSTVVGVSGWDELLTSD